MITCGTGTPECLLAPMCEACRHRYDHGVKLAKPKEFKVSDICNEIDALAENVYERVAARSEVNGFVMTNAEFDLRTLAHCISELAKIVGGLK